jgi:uncharacterized protein (DUF58 family)
MFVHPASISSIQGIELRAKSIVEGFLSGLHKSPYHGFSVEFSEYRTYNRGDALRDVDWKVYAKSDKLMVKKFEADTNVSSQILFDISASMAFKSGEFSKLDYAKNLAAAIMYLLVKQNDAVGLITFSKEIKTRFESKTSRHNLNLMLAHLEALEASEETELNSALDYLTAHFSKRGIFVLFVDFLADEDDTLAKLNYLRRAGHDLIVFHLFDDAELDFNYSGRSIFIDQETGEKADVTPELIREKYLKLSQDLIDKMQKHCRAFDIDYHIVKTSDSYEKHLLEFLQRRQKKN